MALAQVYLYGNSALYALLAVWSTTASRGAATRLGYLALSDRGRAEFLVVYGGLQIGLAVLFFLLARNTSDLALGLRIALGLYAPIVLYRTVTGWMNRPLSGSALGTIGLEALLLATAAWLLHARSA